MSGQNRNIGWPSRVDIGKVAEETEARFSVFIDKLKTRLQEFAEESLPELKAMGLEDPEDESGAFHRMRTAVLGQIEDIRKKASAVYEDAVISFDFHSNEGDLFMEFYAFRDRCCKKHEELGSLIRHYRDAVENTYTEDFEAAYQRILSEYESIKKKFKCSQCGSPITIERLFFTDVYIQCASCRTQNTFKPGSQAKSLEHIGRGLAEQRTTHLLVKHQNVNQELSGLHYKRHQLRIDLEFEKKPKKKAEIMQQLENVEAEYEQTKDFRSNSYETYLRAMFDEWNKISPDLKDEHEKIFISWLKQYKNAKNE